MRSLKGCKIVAGGRSGAQTTGEEMKRDLHLEEVLDGRSFLHPFRVRSITRTGSGGLRSAPTTGYFLHNPPG